VGQAGGEAFVLMSERRGGKRGGDLCRVNKRADGREKKKKQEAGLIGLLGN